MSGAAQPKQNCGACAWRKPHFQGAEFGDCTWAKGNLPTAAAHVLVSNFVRATDGADCPTFRATESDRTA